MTTTFIRTVVTQQIEPFRMRWRLARIKDPRPGRQALFDCWRAIRAGAKAAPLDALSVGLGQYTLHGHHGADLINVFEEIFIAECYCCEITSPQPYILDCGANIGAASLYFKLHYPNARVVAFEPNPVCAAAWRRNLLENGFRDVELQEAACGAADGETDLFFATDKTLGSSIAHQWADTTATRKVRVVRLSQWIDRPVHVLKLDVEGAEHDVLAELVSSGTLKHVERMVIEYHHRLGDIRSSLSGFLRKLEDAGFTHKITGQVRDTRYFDREWQGLLIYAIKVDLLADSLA